MAAAAIVATRRAHKRPHARTGPRISEKRQKALEEELESQKKIHEIFKKYDLDKTGNLDTEQMTTLLTAVDSSTPEGVPPSPEEVQFIIKLVDAEQDGCVNRNEVLFALRAFSILTGKREEIESAMKTYDVSGTGKLNKEELTAYLKDLNGGIDVEEDEVEWVMKQADVFGDGQMSKEELVMATAAWYSHVKEKEKESDKKPKSENSSVCAVL